MTLLNLRKLRDKIIIICGPTASGKSSLAMELASSLDGLIINADAMQVYKELPILTAQPTKHDMTQCMHSLYSIIGVKDPYSVALWLDLIDQELKFCEDNNKTPIIVGGSGLYIKSLVDGLAIIPSISSTTTEKVNQLTQSMSPHELHTLLSAIDPYLGNKLAINDIKRITRGLAVYEETKIPLSEWQISTKPTIARKNFFIINIDIERKLLYKTCDDRFAIMMQNNVLDEVSSFIEDNPNVPIKILGLQELIDYLRGFITKETAITKAQQFTRNYAKRQITWFSRQLQYDHIIRKGYVSP